MEPSQAPPGVSVETLLSLHAVDGNLLLDDEDKQYGLQHIPHLSLRMVSVQLVEQVLQSAICYGSSQRVHARQNRHEEVGMVLLGWNCVALLDKASAQWCQGFELVYQMHSFGPL